MLPLKILMSNLGYMRGINGSLGHHLRYAHRHLYNSVKAQKKSLHQLATLLEKADPDICCFLEIDKGSSDSANFNQLGNLINEKYAFSDIENKYGLHSPLRRLPFSKGKSSAFLSKQPFEYEKLYFSHGTKRLIYKIALAENITLLFAHFSLKKEVRVHQLLHMRKLLQAIAGEVILLGDFNILTGFQELSPLLKDNNLILLNDENVTTFRFHRTHKALDLCICTDSIAPRLALEIVPQPYSDHSALLLTLTPVIPDAA